MKIVYQKLNYPAKTDEQNVYLCTTNTQVKKDGCLVMGAGNAAAFAKAYPKVALELGQLAKTQPSYVTLLVGQNIGTFRTKEHWRDSSQLNTIEQSTAELDKIARDNPGKTYHLPYPGVGYGDLSVESVYAVINTLPDNVITYLMYNNKLLNT